MSDAEFKEGIVQLFIVDSDFMLEYEFWKYINFESVIPKQIHSRFFSCFRQCDYSGKKYISMEMSMKNKVVNSIKLFFDDQRKHDCFILNLLKNNHMQPKLIRVLVKSIITTSQNDKRNGHVVFC